MCIRDRYIVPLLRYKWPDPDDNASLAHSFEQSVEKYKNKDYIFFEDQTWTYSEINNTANILAHKLIEDGISHGDKVIFRSDSDDHGIELFVWDSELADQPSQPETAPENYETPTADNDIIGTNKNDRLKGGRNSDYINGKKGDDKLIGAKGNDC